MQALRYTGIHTLNIHLFEIYAYDVSMFAFFFTSYITQCEEQKNFYIFNSNINVAFQNSKQVIFSHILINLFVYIYWTYWKNIHVSLMLLGFFFPSDFVLVLPSIILIFPSVASPSLPRLSHSSRRIVASLDHEEAVRGVLAQGLHKYLYRPCSRCPRPFVCGRLARVFPSPRTLGLLRRSWQRRPALPSRTKG